MKLAAFFLFACALGAEAHAQSAAPPQISLASLLHATPGSWAEYSMSVAGKGTAVKMRYALIERTAEKMVLEIDSTTPMGPMRMQAEYTANESGEWPLASAKMKMGSSPVQQLSTSVSGAPQLSNKEQGAIVGTETIHTPVGNFVCKHYKRQSGTGKVDVWINDKLTPIGLVKMLDDRGVSIQLIAHGGGATPKIK